MHTAPRPGRCAWDVSDWTVLLAGVAVLSVAFALRLVGLSSQALWYDELQSATFATLPLPELIRSLLAFDPHPPVYYIQLHYWMLLGNSDFWIKLNSVFWSMLTTASLLAIGRKFANTRTALAATAAFAIWPFAVSYAQEARMYTLLMFLGLWSLFFAHRLLDGDGTWQTSLGAIISTSLFLYSQGAGFMILVSLLTYGFYSLIGRRFRPDKAFIRWLNVQLIVLLLYLPWLVRSRGISLQHIILPGIREVADVFVVLAFGFIKPFPGAFQVIGLGLLVLITGFVVIRDRSSRPMVVSTVITPVIVAISISYLIRPIWHYRTLAYIAPFLCLTSASALLELRKSSAERTAMGRLARYSVPVAFSAMLLWALSRQEQTLYEPWDIRSAVRFLQKTAGTEETIYVPIRSMFWSLSWYLAGPGSVNPLSTNYLITTREGLQITSQTPPADPAAAGQTIWFVHLEHDQLALPENWWRDNVLDFNQLRLEHARAAAGNPP